MRALSALLCLVLSLPLAAEEITLASEPVCPYICANSSTGELLTPPGLVIEIVRDALSLHGHQLHYEMRPLARAVREVQAGHGDAILSWEENASGFVLPAEPVVNVDTCFFKRRKDPWQFDGVASLEGRRLGIILGDHAPDPEIEAYLQAHPNDDWVQSVAGSDANLLNIRKLLAGRIDLFFDEKLLTLHHLHQLGHADQISGAGCLPTTQPVYLAFSPENSASSRWAEELSEGIRRLRISGRIQQIWGHYGLEYPVK